MKFYYWADRDSDRSSQIRKSAARNQIEVEPIGLGKMGPELHHSLFKQRVLFEAVDKLDDDEIVCTTDGFDVFYQQDADYMKEQFLSLNHEVVFSAERGYSHQYKKFKSFFDQVDYQSPYKYINSGSVMGYAGALRELYEPSRLLRLGVAISMLPYVVLSRFPKVKETFIDARNKLKVSRSSGPSEKSWQGSYLKWFSYTDQAIMGKYLAKGDHNISIGLDRNCKLFWCTAFEWENIDDHCRLVDGKLQNLHTEYSPACIHVPWISKYKAVFLKLYGMAHAAN
jgi:hypothetical protein